MFELPEDVLATLTPQKQEDQSHEQLYTVETSQQRELTATRHDGPASSATSCALCGLNFVGLQEQRSHVRSDLHGFNLKRRIKGLETVREAEFERLVDGLLVHVVVKVALADNVQSLTRVYLALLRQIPTATWTRRSQISSNRSRAHLMRL